MRTIKPYEDFNVGMRKIETDLMLRLVKMAHGQRGKLADVLVSTGISNPQIVPQVAGVAGATARKAAEELVATLPKMEKPIRKLLDAQLSEDELAYISDGPLADTDGRKAKILAMAGAWAGLIGGKLLLTVFRLQGDGVSTGDAVTALLGEIDVLGVGQTVSPWTGAVNELRVWAVDEFWSDANETLGDAYDQVAEGALAAGTQMMYRKQWISSIDQRTTATCLAMNGQTVSIDDQFDLTGLEPRYSDLVDGPPGHWNCRSSLAIVPEVDAQDDLTQQLLETAQEEIERRKGLAKGERSRELKAVQRKGRFRKGLEDRVPSSGVKRGGS